ncbi:hypothetical protein BRADI_1g37340v3, partial [Brachypodium distachyon]
CNFSLVVWNLRGLNNPGRRSSIRLFLQSFNPSLVCVQESKVQDVDAAVISQTFGSSLDGFDFLPADGTQGGIILAWKSAFFQVSVRHKGEFSISADVVSLADAKSWTVTSVYGPHDLAGKERFLQELVDIGASILGPWLLNGDFNFVCDVADKSNVRVNRRMMSKFRHSINSLALLDMPLQGRTF